MRKAILLTLCVLFFATAEGLKANPAMEITEPNANNVIQPLGGRDIRLVGANGETLEVFNLTGVKVAQIQVDSSEKTITLDVSKGCYILKVNNIVRKVFIQ